LRQWRSLQLGPELFRSLGAEVIAMGVSPDGRNINAGCGSLHLEGLQKRVVAEKARLGVPLTVTPTARCSPAKPEKS